MVWPSRLLRVISGGHAVVFSDGAASSNLLASGKAWVQNKDGVSSCKHQRSLIRVWYDDSASGIAPTEGGGQGWRPCYS